MCPVAACKILGTHTMHTNPYLHTACCSVLGKRVKCLCKQFLKGLSGALRTSGLQARPPNAVQRGQDRTARRSGCPAVLSRARQPWSPRPSAGGASLVCSLAARRGCAAGAASAAGSSSWQRIAVTREICVDPLHHPDGRRYFSCIF